MRLLVLLLVLALVVLLVLVVGPWLLHRGTTVPRRDGRSARWTAVNAGEAGRTIVAVRLSTSRGRVLEERRVAAIHDQDPEYEALLLEAMAQARSRAGLLNAELG